MSESFTNTYIIGAGAIGHLLACHCALANTPITIIRRQTSQPATATVIFNQPDQDSREFSLEYQPSADVVRIDTLFVAVKAYQVEAALTSVCHALHDDSVVILLSNGMGNLETTTGILQAAKLKTVVCPTINTHGCYLDKSAEHVRVIHSGIGEILYGANYLTDDHSSVPELVLPEVLAVRTVANIEQRLWLKLAINAAINPLTAIHNCQNGRLLENSDLFELVQALVIELADLYDLLQVGLSHTDIQDAVASVIKATAANYSSMQRDIARKSQTEIEAITGYLLRCADSMQFHMQEHQYLYQQIKNIEQGHKLANK